MDTNEMRDVDRARASQLVTAQLSGDSEMFALAVQEMFDDDYGLGGMGATINVLRGLSEDLAHVILVNHGDQALPLMRTVIARQISGRYEHGEGDSR